MIVSGPVRPGNVVDLLEIGSRPPDFTPELELETELLVDAVHPDLALHPVGLPHSETKPGSRFENLEGLEDRGVGEE